MVRPSWRLNHCTPYISKQVHSENRFIEVIQPTLGRAQSRHVPLPNGTLSPGLTVTHENLEVRAWLMDIRAWLTDVSRIQSSVYWQRDCYA